MKKLQAAKPKHELKTAKSCDNHLWVNHCKPYYKKKAYIFCCGEIFYCDYQSHLRRAIAQSAISHAYAASYWALLHTRLHLHHTCKHKDLYVQYTNPHTHTQTFLSQQGHLHTLCIIYQNTPSDCELWATQTISPTETVRPFKHFHPSYCHAGKNEESHPSFPLESPWGSFITKGEKSLSAVSLTDQAGRWREEEKGERGRDWRV